MTVQDILDALQAVGGAKARALVGEAGSETEENHYSGGRQMQHSTRTVPGMKEDVSLTKPSRLF